MEKPCFNVTFPKQASGDAARRYLQRELEFLEAELEAFSGASIEDQGLRNSIQLYNESRRLMRDLDRMRAGNPNFLSTRQMTEVVLASSFLPREEHLLLLRDLLASSSDPEGRSRFVYS